MKKENKIISWLGNSKGNLWLFIAAVILLNIAATRAFFRIDITGPKSYSLSQASKEAVRTLEEPLSIKVFFNKNLPAPYNNVEQYLRDILSEYKTAAGKNFSYEFFEMEKSENQKIARSYGIQEVQVREVKNNEVGLKKAFMGLAIVYADQIEKLDGLSTSDGLEYKLTTSISRIIAKTNIFAGLTDNVRLTLYKSEDLSKITQIANFSQIEPAVEDAFRKVNRKFNNKIEFSKVNPNSSQALELSRKYGIQNVRYTDENGQASNGSIGLVLEYGDKFRIVPMELANMIFNYAVTGLEDLEESIQSTAENLVSKTSLIAYITGHGERNIQDENDAAYFASLLSDYYTLEEVNLSEKNIPAAAETVIINGPKSEYSEEELYKIDQFIMRGGNVMFLVDSYDEQVMNQYGMQLPVYTPVDSGIQKLLSAYGVEVGNEYVFDEKCFSQLDRQYGKLNFYYVPQVQKKNLNQKNPITRNLGEVFFLESFPLDPSKAQEDKDIDVTILAKTSPASWTVPVTEGFALSPVGITKPQDKEKFGEKTVCLLLEGKPQSAFLTAPDFGSKENDASQSDATLSAQNHLSAAVQKSKIFVAGTSFITSAQLIQPNSTEPVAYFVRGSVDYMCQKEDLCQMRTKNLSINTLRQVKPKAAAFVKYFNQAGLAVLAAIAGLLVYMARKRHRENIRRLYDPENPRDSK